MKQIKKNVGKQNNTYIPIENLEQLFKIAKRSKKSKYIGEHMVCLACWSDD